MEVRYRTFNPSDSAVVSELMQNLYREDPGGKPMSPHKAQKTFEALTGHPDRGVIMVLESEHEIIGYALLIPFWSNEFGGNIVNIDELYIRKAFRSRGTGTGFIKYLAETRFGNAVALQLEVTPGNGKARKLYESLGFKRHKNDTYDLEL